MKQARQSVWDPMVRVGHWALAGFFLLAYWLGGERLSLHSHAGYTVALLVGFRVFWGFAGSAHARFADFVPGPAVLADYLRQLARRRVQTFPGHDPLGSVMIIALLLVLAVTALSGVALFTLENRGPLADTALGNWVAAWPGGLVEDVHHVAADLAMVLVVAHVVGVIVMSFLMRENLVAAMLHGDKTRTDDSDLRSQDD